MACCPSVKKRNPIATRAAILDAARDRFLRESYDSVGLRDIAARAGVDVALIGRYFGGKEGLFREVLFHKKSLSRQNESQIAPLKIEQYDFL